MLMVKIVELNKTRYADGTVTPHGINELLIEELAKDGWQMTVVFEPPGRPTPLGVFYRKSQPTPEHDAKPKKKVGRPKKDNA